MEGDRNIQKDRQNSVKTQKERKSISEDNPEENTVLKV